MAMSVFVFTYGLMAQDAAQGPTGDLPLSQEDLSIFTGNVQRPNGIGFFDNFLYIACTGDQTIYETNSETGQTRTYTYGVGNAHSVYVEESNNQPQLWIPDYLNNSLVRIVRGGSTQTVAEGLDGPWGIAYLDPERFLISNLLGDTVEVVTRLGERELFVDDLASPAGLVIDDDLLYVANNGSTRRAIEWYDLDNPRAGEDQLLLAGIQNTTGLQLASDGYLYFAFALGTRGVIGRIDPVECREKGGCTADDVEIVLYSELEAPLAGLTIAPDLRLFVHSMFDPSLYWVQLPS